MKAKKNKKKFNDLFLMKRRDPLVELVSQLKLLLIFSKFYVRGGEVCRLSHVKSSVQFSSWLASVRKLRFLRSNENLTLLKRQETLVKYFWGQTIG